MKVIKLIFKVIWTISLQNIFLWLGMAWKWAWSKTEVDEKVISTVKETGRRLDNAADEMGDVVDALKEVKNRLENASDEMEDVVDALKGKKINPNGKAKKA